MNSQIPNKDKSHFASTWQIPPRRRGVRDNKDAADLQSTQLIQSSMGDKPGGFY